MAKLLIFTEHTNGSLKRSALELLTFAQSISFEAVAVIAGSDSSSVIDELSSWGVKSIHQLGDASFDLYNPELFELAFSEIIKSENPNFILSSCSSIGRDLFPRVAASLGLSCASDCTNLTWTGDMVQVTKPLYSGKCIVDVTFKTTPIVLMRANQIPVGICPKASSKASVKAIAPATNSISTFVKEVLKGASQKMDLTEANIIVAGGRGLKGPENVKLLYDLAEVLGASVGASRAIVDAGWMPHDLQVGQTGKTVAPTLYIAVGISGAIQHLAGMSGSKVIVAINSDANAPIFQKANYGIVGDLFEVLPKLKDEFKKAFSN